MKYIKSLVIMLVLCSSVFDSGAQTDGSTNTPAAVLPSPANNWSGLTGDALAGAVKAYYAKLADGQATAALQKAATAAQDPLQLQQQITQLTQQNAALKKENEQLKQDKANYQTALQKYTDADHARERQWIDQQKAQNNTDASKSALPGSSNANVVMAEDVVADFDTNEDSAKNKYSSQPVQIRGLVKDFLYDPLGNGDIVIILAQSPTHKVGIKLNQQQLANLKFPPSTHIFGNAPQMVHYDSSLKEIVGSAKMPGTNGNTIVRGNIPLLQLGSSVDIDALYSEMDGITSTAKFNAE